MNFVRTFEPRDAAVEEKLLETARDELRLINEMRLPATVLLEYDALVDERYVELFTKEAGSNIELGLWYEIVEPLTSAIGIPYNSKRGYKWDWNIDPGFPMSYDNQTKERLIDQAMHKFHEVFGYYPRTVGSWVIDTYTYNYLKNNYKLDAVCICRDQINTDAYTMVGGYFNGFYFPSENNIFTPSNEPRTHKDVPVARLLGPDPIHNYDGRKQLSEDLMDKTTVFTLEPACEAGKNPECIDWFFRTFFKNESLSQAYCQIGQENSFAMFDLITPLRMQFEKLIEMGIRFEKMCDTGAHFSREFGITPGSAVTALDNWDKPDIQSVQYSSYRYTANVFRRDGVVAIRNLYFFDNRVADTYLTEICSTFDSIHENMPIVDTYYQRGDTDGGEGIILDTGATSFEVKAIGDNNMRIIFGKKEIVLDEDRIKLVRCNPLFTPKMSNTTICVVDGGISYTYNGNSYALRIEGGSAEWQGERIAIIPEGDTVTLTPCEEL